MGGVFSRLKIKTISFFADELLIFVHEHLLAKDVHSELCIGFCCATGHQKRQKDEINKRSVVVLSSLSPPLFCFYCFHKGHSLYASRLILETQRQVTQSPCL